MLTSWSISGHPGGGVAQDNQANRLVAEELDEAEPGAAALGTLTGLELVCDGLDDRDAEASLAEVLAPSRSDGSDRSRDRRPRPPRRACPRAARTRPAPFPRRPLPYPWRTEFEQASVTASLRSPSVSSSSGRRRARPLSASRTRVMYSGLAGIRSFTDRPSPPRPGFCWASSDIGSVTFPLPRLAGSNRLPAVGRSRALSELHPELHSLAAADDGHAH